MRLRNLILALVIVLGVCQASPAQALTLINELPVSLVTSSTSTTAISLNDALSRVVFRLKRFTTLTPQFWPDATTGINVSVELSFNGGISWQVACGVGSNGGLFVFRTGVEATETTLSCSLQPGIGRLIRLNSTVTNGPLVSAFTLEVF